MKNKTTKDIYDKTEPLENENKDGWNSTYLQKSSSYCCTTSTDTENKKDGSNTFFLIRFLKKFYFIIENNQLIIVLFLANLLLLNILHIVLPENDVVNYLMNKKSFFPFVVATIAMILLYPHFLLGTIDEVKERVFGVQFTIMIATTFSYILSFVLFILNHVAGGDYTVFFDAVVGILVFLTIGQYIDKRIKIESSYSIESILKLKNPKAILENGAIIPLKMIQPNQRIRINQNSDILVDGNIVKGETYVSESFLTGESYPIKKHVGSEVYAGSTNVGKAVIVKVKATLEESNLSRIVKQSKLLSNTKPKMQKIADKIANRLISVMLISAVIAFLYKYFALEQGWIEALVFSISMFVIVCPCALGILTPGILMISSSTLNRRNILVKNKSAIEGMKDINVVAFDKTGTVVSSNLTVDNWTGNDELLAIVKGIETHSEHPIAKSILSYKPNISPIIPNNFVKEIIGIGVIAKHNDKTYMLGGNKLLAQEKLHYDLKMNEIIVILNQQIVASFIVKVKVNPKLEHLIKLLKKRGLFTTLLSGDSIKNTKQLALSIGFDDYKGEMTPEDKLKEISHFESQNRKVLYVGDGINDMLALSKASISVAVASDYSAFNIPSDIVIFNDEIANIYPMIDILKKTRLFIILGILWSMSYNVVVVLATIFLSIDPLLGAAIMVGNDFLVFFIIFGFKLLRLGRKDYYSKKYLTKMNLLEATKN